MLLCSLQSGGPWSCTTVPRVRPLIWSVFRNEAYCHCVDQRSQGNQHGASQVGRSWGDLDKEDRWHGVSNQPFRVIRR